MTQRLTTPPYNYTNSITRNQVMFRPYQADLRGQPGSSYPPLSLNLSPVQSVDVDLQPQLRIPTMFSCTVCSDDSDSLSACTAAPQRTQNIHTLFSKCQNNAELLKYMLFLFLCRSCDNIQ